jgi:hypothetical protein
VRTYSERTVNVAAKFGERVDGTLNALYPVEEPKMKSKLNLMAAMVGLAMLATPIAASARDYRNGYVRAPRSYAAPAVTTHVGRYASGAALAPAAAAMHSVPAWHGGGWHDGYRGYGYRGYAAAPMYAAPVTSAPVYAPTYAAPAYAGPTYGGYGPTYGGGYGAAYGNPCRSAQSVMYNYYKDRNTGHPAAAYDLLRQNQWAAHSGCGSTPGGSTMLSPLLGFFR